MRNIFGILAALLVLSSCQLPVATVNSNTEGYTYRVQTPQVLESPSDKYNFVVEYRTCNAKSVRYLDFKGDEWILHTLLDASIIGFPLFYNGALMVEASNAQVAGDPVFAEIWINGKLAASSSGAMSASLRIDDWRSYVINNPISLIGDSVY